MRNRLLPVFGVLALGGCQSVRDQVEMSRDTQPVVQLTDADEFPPNVGKRVEVVGVVTNTKCPQVCGIDAWELDRHRGKRVKLRGTLRETVVTQEALDEVLRTRSIPHRGAGRFYSLADIEFEVLQSFRQFKYTNSLLANSTWHHAAHAFARRAAGSFTLSARAAS